MTDSEIARLLERGIQAAREEQAWEARQLLEQVVALDPAVAEAWWWLSQVVADPQERIVCLENVLTLEPHHEEARNMLRVLRAGQLVDGPPAPAGEGEDLSDDPLDDPYQCIYCAGHTHPHDETCPHCGRRLVTYERRAGHRSTLLVPAVAVIVLLGLWSGLDGVGLLLRLSRGGAAPESVQSLVNLGLVDPTMLASQTILGNPFLKAIFGDLVGMEYALARRLFDVASLRMIVLIVLAAALFSRLMPVYYGALAIVLIGMVWDVIQLASGFTGWFGGLVGLSLGVLALLMLFQAEDDFALDPVRMQLRPHRAAQGAVGNFDFGLRYTRQGKHALAALHFRRAVGSMPSNPAYYKRLGLSLARIGHFARSLRELERGRQLAPGDSEFSEIERLVRELQRQARADYRGS